jgi:hypothetical protein
MNGRQLLAYEIDIKAWHPGGRTSGPGAGSHHTVRKMRDGRAFWLDDGSGQRAWIAPQGAQLVMPTQSYGESAGEVIGGLPETLHVWTPQIEAWARGHAGGSMRRLKVATRELEVGSTLSVLGSAQQRNGVICLDGNTPAQELVLSTVTEAQLEGVLGKRGRGCWGAGLLGVGLTLGGVAMIVITILQWLSSVQ